MDVYPGLTKVLLRMGQCKCGHAALEHWHNGPIALPEVYNCGEKNCRCRLFKKVSKKKERI